MQLFEDISGLVSNKLAVLQNIGLLIRLETRTFGLSIMPLMINLLLLFVVLSFTWFAASCITGILIFQLYPSLIAVLSAVFAINLVIAGLLIQYLRFNVRNMSFAQTRKFLSNQDIHNREQKNQTNPENQAGGKEIK